MVLETKQVAELVNIATKNALGCPVDSPDLIQEDLTGVVDAGIKLADAHAYENFLYELGVAVSARIFVSRTYTSKAPNIMRTTFEYGQIIQKTRMELDDASPNQSYQLQNGVAYPTDIYEGGTVKTKIFKNRVTFEIRKSITEEQIKNAFSNAQELGNFTSMVFTMVQNSIQVKMDKLIMMTICNMIGQTMRENNETTSVNLLAEYKKIYPTSTLTAATCTYDKDFLKFASSEINLRTELLVNYAKIFNNGESQVHSPKDMQHVVLLSEVASRFATYLESDTFHNELVKLPFYETVNFWQGLGSTGKFKDTSKIDIKTNDGYVVQKSGIIGIIFDHDALAVTRISEKVNARYNESADFINYWFKNVMECINDFDENFVVFYVAD